MVRILKIAGSMTMDFPRIRGDGPISAHYQFIVHEFSPYSRGWSQALALADVVWVIFPVFAGMVPTMTTPIRNAAHFPRIRGDGPVEASPVNSSFTFSPYSRGWSQNPHRDSLLDVIFPVFAGMVRRDSTNLALSRYFPRIRGDGPDMRMSAHSSISFSPYSRG